MGGVPIVKLRALKRVTGTYYQLRYKEPDGRIRRISAGTNKRLAEQIAAQIQADLINGRFNLSPGTADPKSIPELISEYLKQDASLKSAKTLKRYEDQLAGFERFMRKYFSSAHGDIRMIKDFHIRECRDQLAKGFEGQKKWKPATINRTLEMIGGMLKYAVEKGYLSTNPATGTRHIPIPEKGIPEYYSRDELEKIWQAADPYWLPFFKFLYFTGLRKGEAINLTWDRVHLNVQNPFIEVTSSPEWRTKTKKTRTVQLNESAKEILESKKGDDSKFVFPAEGGGIVHPNIPYRALKQVLKGINIEGDLHKFRHTFASHLVMEGVSIETLRSLLGHSSLEMTQKYAHLSPGFKQDAVEKLDKLS